MDQSTRYPEAVPLKEFSTETVADKLIQFFSHFGFPKEIQSDQGSNFMSHVFQILMRQLGIKQLRSTPYHPESQGALKHYHQVVKNMLRTYCQEHEDD